LPHADDLIYFPFLNFFGEIMEDKYEVLERIHETQRQLRQLECSWTYVEPETNPRCRYCGRRIPIHKRGAVWTCPCGAKYLLVDFDIDYETGKAYVVFIDLGRREELEERYELLMEELEMLRKRFDELVEEEEIEEEEEAKILLRELERRGYRVDEVGDDYVVINGRRIGVVFDGEAYYPDTDDEELAEIIRELMLLHERGYV